MEKRLMMFLACFFLFLGGALAQTTISGTVVSAEDGEPIVGAAVTIAGTKTGTVSDVDGKFTLNVEPGSNLRVSYLGMKDKTVKAANNLKIQLFSNDKTLDEVVVTAMGISRDKKSLGYASQDLKAEKLTEGASTSLSDALQGKVSGVDISPSSGMPGASSRITIRGVRSFTGDNTPLYVVDGMPISSVSDISTFDSGGGSIIGTDMANRGVDIDPNDIESINILKGQAASALYGMRANNGVIIIMTKSGKGARKGKPQITYNTNMAWSVVSTLPDFQKEYAQGRSGKYNPSASTSWGPKISDLPNDPNYGGNTDNNYTAAYGKHEGMYYQPQRAKAGLDPWTTPQSYDNAKDFFQTGHTWSNNVNIAQSFDKGNYSFSLGNTNSEAIIPETGMDRYNAKFSAEAQLAKNWSTGFNGNFVFSKIRKQPSANDGFLAAVYGAPASYDLKGIPDHIAGDEYTQTLFRNLTFDNPYWAVDNNKFTERSQRYFGDAYIKYTSDFGTDNMKLDVKYQLGADAYTTDYSDIWGYGHKGGKGSADLYSWKSREINSLLTANYDWKLSEDWDLNALVGNEIVDKHKYFKDETGTEFNFSGWNSINNAITYSASDRTKNSRTVGFFGNLSMSYKDMLFLTVTGRNDIVSSMPHGNRSFFYPSVSGGFIFTELPALKNKVLTYGKIRASYAQVGQAGEYIQSYYYTPVYGGGFSNGSPIVYPIGSVQAFIPYYRIYDPNLKPQNTKSYEFGFDLAFWNGLVTLNATYSRQNVKDQIFPVPLDGATGYQEVMTNGGKIHTNSYEVTLGIKPFDTRDFKWSMEFNFSKIDNYVDELAEGVNSIYLGGFTTPQVRASIGDKFPVIYGSTYLRNENGDIVVDADGMPQAGEPGVIGKVSPDFRLGFNTTFEYKKLRLSATFDWKQGGEMYCGTTDVLDYYGVTQRSADYRNAEYFYFEKPAVKQNADGSYSPNDIKIKGSDAFYYFNTLTNIDEVAIHKTSFFKLREISLSYPVFSKPWLGVNASIFARDIILYSALKGFDPEASQGNDNMSGSFERYSLPGTTSFGFGLTFKF